MVATVASTGAASAEQEARAINGGWLRAIAPPPHRPPSVGVAQGRVHETARARWLHWSGPNGPPIDPLAGRRTGSAARSCAIAVRARHADRRGPPPTTPGAISRELMPGRRLQAGGRRPLSGYGAGPDHAPAAEPGDLTTTPTRVHRTTKRADENRGHEHADTTGTAVVRRRRPVPPSPTVRLHAACSHGHAELACWVMDRREVGQGVGGRAVR